MLKLAGELKNVSKACKTMGYSHQQFYEIRRDFQIYGAQEQLEEIEHRTTKVRRPQSNGFVERLHRILLDVHFRITWRTKFYVSIDEMQIDLDVYLSHYNNEQAHQGRNMNGRTPYQAFIDGNIFDDSNMNSVT